MIFLRLVFKKVWKVSYFGSKETKLFFRNMSVIHMGPESMISGTVSRILTFPPSNPHTAALEWKRKIHWWGSVSKANKRKRYTQGGYSRFCSRFELQVGHCKDAVRFSNPSRRAVDVGGIICPLCWNRVN